MENQDEQSSSMDYVSVWRALPPSLKLSLLPLTSSAVLVTSGNDLAYALTKVFGGEDVMLADVSASLLAIHVLLSIAVFARIFEIANQRHHTLSASDQSVSKFRGRRGSHRCRSAFRQPIFDTAYSRKPFKASCRALSARASSPCDFRGLLLFSVPALQTSNPGSPNPLFYVLCGVSSERHLVISGLRGC